MAAGRRRRRDPRAALLGRSGTTPSRSTGVPRTRSPSGCSTSCARRCSCARSATCRSACSSPAGIDSSTNAALFSEGESDAGQDVLDRLRRRVRAATRTSSHYARQMAERVGAEHHERLLTRRRPARLPAARWSQLQDEPIADPVCVPRLLRLEARARATASSSPGRRGRRRAVLGLPVLEDAAATCSATTTCRCPRVAEARRRAPRATRRQGATRREVEYLRRGAAGQPIFWGGAEAFTDTQKQRLLSPRLRARARRPHLLGRARADPRALRRAGAGSPRT